MSARERAAPLFGEPGVQQVCEGAASVYRGEHADHFVVLYDDSAAVSLLRHHPDDLIERRVGRNDVRVRCHGLLDGGDFGVDIFQGFDQVEVTIREQPHDAGLVQDGQVANVVLTHHRVSERHGLIPANRVRGGRHEFLNRGDGFGHVASNVKQHAFHPTAEAATPRESSESLPCTQSLRLRANVAPQPHSNFERQFDEITFGQNANERFAVEHDQAIELTIQHGLRGLGERRRGSRGGDLGLHGLFHHHQVERLVSRVRTVAQRPDQPAVEEVALADDASQLSLFVDDREMAKPPEFHHAIGDDQLLVSTQGHQLTCHHITNEALLNCHAQRQSTGRAVQSYGVWPMNCMLDTFVAQPPPTARLVLLVDDDLRTSRRLAAMLREDGFAVEIARDGAAAIARLARTPVLDAVVTELNTAHADGHAISLFARTRNPHMPIIVVTGHPHLFHSESFAAEPPVVFTKPVDYAALRDTLSVAFNRTPVGNE